MTESCDWLCGSLMELPNHLLLRLILVRRRHTSFRKQFCRSESFSSLFYRLFGDVESPDWFSAFIENADVAILICGKKGEKINTGRGGGGGNYLGVSISFSIIITSLFCRGLLSLSSFFAFPRRRRKRGG